MHTEEIDLPLITQDFDAGDRVYRYAEKTDHILFGTVKAVVGRDIIIDMDSGLEFVIPVTLFRKRDPRDFWWGKCLPLARLEKGSVISCIWPHTDGKRWKATVDEVTENSVTFTAVEDKQAKTEWTATDKHSLEYLFRDWIVEE